MEISNDILSIFIPDWILVLAGIAISFIITFISIPPIVSVAHSKGLYDMPNGRTSHYQATPYLGGVAVFAGIVLSIIIITGLNFGRELIFIVGGLIMLLLIGLKDDMLIINPSKKLFGQIIASSLIVVLGNLRIDNFYGTLGIEGIPYFISVLFTIFVIIVIVNGINLIDGIDGLASGIGIIITITFGGWFYISGHYNYAVLSFVTAGSLTAFFYYNVFGKKNKIFLGDAGSLIIGLIIAVLTIQFLRFQVYSFTHNIHSAPAVAFGILIIPLFDTLRVFILRISQARSPFSADRQHMHHVLLDIGNSHLRTTIILSLINIGIIYLSISLQQLSNILLIGVQIFIASILSFLAIKLLQRKRNKSNILNFKHISLYVNKKSSTDIDIEEQSGFKKEIKSI